jgi:ABC-2 type transport system permease protein
MIRRALVIGIQEFVKYVTRRGFIISLLMMPLILVIATAVPSFTASHPRTNVMTVVDFAGGYDQAIARALARDKALAEISAFADYVHQNTSRRALERTDAVLARLLATPKRIASAKEFAARGGWHAAFDVVSPLLKPGAPAFSPPSPEIILVAPPPELTEDFAAGRHGEALSYLTGAMTVTAAGRPQRLNSIVVIPKGFAPGSATDAQYWSIDSQQSVEFVRWALTDAFRIRTNQALVPPEARSRVTLDVDAGLTVIDPTQGRKLDWRDRIAQLVPMGLAFLLFIVAFSDAALLLQSVVEEKSSRMIEMLMSCASPHEIMTGKLIGVTGLALVTLSAWGLMAFGIASFFSGSVMPIVIAGLKSLVPVLPLVIIYFFCGLLIYSAIFLCIGATTSNLPDAQALIGPASMIIILPNMLMSALIQDPNGTLSQIISWIPIYTPFFMLVRLPFHPAPFELWATAALTILTTFWLIRQMGRVFARHVLTTERPPSFARLIGQLFGRRKAV